jgi:hypothetical protein
LIVTALPITGNIERSKIEVETACYQCIPPPQNMIGWWTGDSSTSDLIGNNDGTWIGNEQYSKGVVDNAFDFDGSSYVEIPHHMSLDLGANDFTIDFWMEIGYKGGLIDKYDTTTITGFTVWTELIYGQKSSYSIFFKIDSFEFMSGYTVDYGDLVYVAIVVDRSIIDGGSIYINGYKDSFDAQPIGNINNNKPLKIGYSSKYNIYNDGFIDEVEIFDRALTESEILAIYNAGSVGKCRPLYLSITALFNQPCVSSCDAIIYRIPWQRSTACTLNNVVITNRLPTYTLFRSANLGGFYDSSTGEITWNLGTVSNDGAVLFSVVVDSTPLAGGLIHNEAIFTSDETGITTASIDIPICDNKIIDITIQTGFGNGFSFDLENSGDVDTGEINYNIVLEGGFILSGLNTSGTISNLPAGGTETINTEQLFGIGLTEAKVTISCRFCEKTENASGFMLGNLVLVFESK